MADTPDAFQLILRQLDAIEKANTAAQVAMAQRDRDFSIELEKLRGELNTLDARLGGRIAMITATVTGLVTAVAQFAVWAMQR